MYAASEGDFCFFLEVRRPLVNSDSGAEYNRGSVLLTMGKVSSGGHNKGIGIELAQNQRADIPVSDQPTISCDGSCQIRPK